MLPAFPPKCYPSVSLMGSFQAGIGMIPRPIASEVIGSFGKKEQMRLLGISQGVRYFCRVKNRANGSFDRDAPRSRVGRARA